MFLSLSLRCTHTGTKETVTIMGWVWAALHMRPHGRHTPKGGSNPMSFSVYNTHVGAVATQPLRHYAAATAHPRWVPQFLTTKLLYHNWQLNIRHTQSSKHKGGSRALACSLADAPPPQTGWGFGPLPGRPKNIQFGEYVRHAPRPPRGFVRRARKCERHIRFRLRADRIRPRTAGRPYRDYGTQVVR
jgi:hypothetical protein